MTQHADSGRGPQATADMKARLAALRDDGQDVIEVLWERHRRALSGEGYTYDYAQPKQPQSL